MSLQKTWELFYIPGHCVEVRATGLRGNNRAWEGYASGAVVGYFNDYNSFYAAVTNLDKLTAKGVYIKCNPIKIDLMARANNRMVGATFDNCAKEEDVVDRRWLRLDIDPVRPSGISSTQEELQFAVTLARNLVNRLEADGWGRGIVCTSGNGADILYRINLPTEAKEIIKETLAYLSKTYSTAEAKIDTNLINANIDTKVYGTVARKGENMPTRPHRRSAILDIPGEYKLVTDLLIRPQPKVKNQRSFNGDTPSLAQVEEWLSVLPNPVGEYNEWIKILMAVHSAYPGQDGIVLCNRYIGNPENPNEIEQKFKGFNGDGTGLGTLVEYAKRHGWQAPVRERQERNSDESSTADLNWGIEKKKKEEEPKEEVVSVYTADASTMYRCLVRKNSTEEIAIADFVARITKVIYSEEGAKTYTIAGNAKRGGPFTCEIDAKDFEDTGRLKGIIGAAAGALDSIHAGQREYVAPAIKAISNEVDTSKRYSRTGWVGSHFLIPGNEQPGEEVVLPTKLTYSFSPGDLNKGIEALSALIFFMGEDVAPIVLGHAFTAPLARVAGWNDNRYGLFVRGRTGTHKTSVMQCVMAIYGSGYMNRENLILWGRKFGSTVNALMGYARHASDLPLLIDNFKPYSADDPRDLIGFIHATMEGSDKDRLDRHGNLQEAAPFRCWPCFTGEDLPDSDAAALARLLTIDSRKAGNMAGLTKVQQLAAHLPAIGHAWITWLETEEGQAVVRLVAERLPELREEFAAKIIDKAPDVKNPYRIATNLATNLIAWQVMTYHPTTLGSFAKRHTEKHMDRLDALSVQIAEQTSEAAEAQQLLARLSELIAAGKVIIGDKSKTPDSRESLVGWRVSDLPGDNSQGIYLLIDAARSAVLRLSGYDLTGFSSKTLYEQLAELGYIGTLKDPGRKTKQIRIAGTRVVTVHITAKAIFGDDEGLSEL